MTTWSAFGGKLAVEDGLRKSCVGHVTREAVPVQAYLQFLSSCSALELLCLVFCLAIFASYLS